MRQRLVRAMRLRLAWAVQAAQKRVIRTFARGGKTTFFEPAEFAWVAEVESACAAIRAELDEVLQEREAVPNFQDISSDQRGLTSDDRWKTLVFYVYGHPVPENCARCPQTVRVLNDIPGMKTAMFSIMSAGKHIPPHKGPCAGVLRYHLGLKIPDPPDSCGIRVGGDVRNWQEGASLVFDDTHEHEAWNDSQGERVVLFVDVARPLPRPFSTANDWAVGMLGASEFAQEIARKSRRRSREAAARTG